MRQRCCRVNGKVKGNRCIFGDIHAAFAYASSGDEAALAGVIDHLRALAGQGHPLAGAVALPLVMGITAFAAGDLAAAVEHLEPAASEIHRIGGSHAQWEVFEETMVVCYLRLGRYDDALQLLRRRLACRPSRRDRLWAEEAEAALRVRSPITTDDRPRPG